MNEKIILGFWKETKAHCWNPDEKDPEEKEISYGEHWDKLLCVCVCGKIWFLSALDNR